MWTELDSQPATDAFLKACYAFHDGLLREIRVVTEGQVGETSAVLLLEDLSGEHRTVEVSCHGVVHLSLRPSPPDHDSIISGGRMVRGGGTVRLDINFIRGPLHGPPGGTITIPDRDFTSPDFSVAARAMAWKPAV